MIGPIGRICLISLIGNVDTFHTADRRAPAGLPTQLSLACEDLRLRRREHAIQASQDGERQDDGRRDSGSPLRRLRSKR